MKRETGPGADDVESRIGKVMRFAERNSYRRVCLRDAALFVDLSPKYLSRIFREYTNKRFSEYRLEIKMDRAKELLRQRSKNINEIADRVGYENTESFIRIFKKMTGLTPTGYRKKEAQKLQVIKK